MLMNLLSEHSLALFSSHLDVLIPYIKYCTPTAMLASVAPSVTLEGWKYFSCLLTWPPDAQGFSSDISIRTLLTVLP